MNFDTPAGYAFIGAIALALIGLFVLGAASTPLAHLLGMRRDSLWWFSPAGGRTQGLVVAYLGGLGAVGALIFVAVEGAWEGATPLAWTLCWVSTLLLLGVTVTRVARVAVRIATEGRASFDDPDPELFVEADDALDDLDLVAARAAAKTGDWQPAAQLLSVSLDHDTRFTRILALAELALRRSRWLDAWVGAHPGDRNALAICAQLAVRRAWELRGGESSPRDVEALRADLEDAEYLVRAAIENDPTDPSPRAILVEMARGEEIDTEEFEARTEALYALAPHHQGGHEAELQYRCKKWFGSAEEMFACARRAVAAAPEGNALNLLVVTAHLEHTLVLAERSPVQALKHARDPETVREIDAAIARWQAGEHGPSPVNKAQAHNLLAFYFWLTENKEACRPHLAETRQHLGFWPWMTVGDPGAIHAEALQWVAA